MAPTEKARSTCPKQEVERETKQVVWGKVCWEGRKGGVPTGTHPDLPVRGLPGPPDTGGRPFTRVVPHRPVQEPGLQGVAGCCCPAPRGHRPGPRRGLGQYRGRVRQQRTGPEPVGSVVCSPSSHRAGWGANVRWLTETGSRPCIGSSCGVGAGKSPLSVTLVLSRMSPAGAHPTGPSRPRTPGQTWGHTEYGQGSDTCSARTSKPREHKLLLELTRSEGGGHAQDSRACLPVEDALGVRSPSALPPTKEPCEGTTSWRRPRGLAARRARASSGAGATARAPPAQPRPGSPAGVWPPLPGCLSIRGTSRSWSPSSVLHSTPENWSLRGVLLTREGAWGSEVFLGPVSRPPALLWKVRTATPRHWPVREAAGVGREARPRPGLTASNRSEARGPRGRLLPRQEQTTASGTSKRKGGGG